MTYVSIVERVNSLANDAAPILLDAAWKSLLILAFASGASLLMRRASAATRHLLWSIALLLVVVVPLLTTLLPDLAFANGLGESSPVQGMTRLLPPLAFQIRAATVPRSAESRAAVVVQLPGVLLLIWSAGVLVSVCPLVLGTISLRRRERHSAPVSDPRLRRLFDDARRGLSLLGPVRLLTGTRRNMPMISGVLRRSILLPATALGWSDFRLRIVLLHELGHAKRGDCVMWPLAQVVRAIYWFNPLVWFGVARLRAEQERACDDLVLRAQTSGVDYAEQLVELAAAYRPPAFPFVALAMARTSQTERRVMEILDPWRNRRRVGLRQAVTIALLAIAVAIPLACAHAGSPQQIKAPSSRTLDPVQHHRAGEQALEVNRAVQMFTAHHSNQLPPTLGATLPEMMDLEEVDRATAAMKYVLLASGQRINPPKQPTPQWVDANTTFTYLGRTALPINKIARPGETVGFYQYLHGGPGEEVLLCFLDGHVEWMTGQEAEHYIAKSREKFGAAAKR